MGKQAERRINTYKAFALAVYIKSTAEMADNLAIAVDGHVPSTWEMMTEQQLANFFRASYRLAEKVLAGEE